MIFQKFVTLEVVVGDETFEQVRLWEEVCLRFEDSGTSCYLDTFRVASRSKFLSHKDNN